MPMRVPSGSDGDGGGGFGVVRLASDNRCGPFGEAVGVAHVDAEVDEVEKETETRDGAQGDACYCPGIRGIVQRAVVGRNRRRLGYDLSGEDRRCWRRGGGGWDQGVTVEDVGCLSPRWGEG